MERSAYISHCGRYRYLLTRTWDPGLPSVLFVGLNPSTADGEQDDATVRRCIGFAKEWGYGALRIANLFAYRATDPRTMMQMIDPIGPNNDVWLKTISDQAKLTVVCWGARGSYMDRAQRVLTFLHKPHHLGLTKDGHPRHPLYLKSTCKPAPYDLRSVAHEAEKQARHP